MRILHVGSGFRPWRHGGLVAYTEDLMDAQLAAGHDVAYFFAGRQYPLARGPRLRRWEQRGVAMLEVVDSPLHDHGRQPALEVSEPRLERMFADVVAEVAPDVVHVHELAGLPWSLIGRSPVPVVVTLQDYFAVCSAFKLLGGPACLAADAGAECAAAVAADPRPAGLSIEATLRHDVGGRLRRLHQTRLNPSLRSAYARVAAAEARRRGPADQRPELFRRRREANVAALNRAAVTIGMSHRVTEIHAALGVTNLRTLHLTLAHFSHLQPRQDKRVRPFCLVFGTLAGFESEAKGARLVLDAARRLTERGYGDRARILVHGRIDPRFRPDAAALPIIEIGQAFRPGDLDRILDEVDVGLIPSVWEEAYGYVGIEFLAKGIPLIANAVGGMPDYTREGETGWLNHSCTGAELADRIAHAVDHPDEVAALRERVIANRDAIVKPMAAHVAEMDAIYAEAVG